MMVRWLTQRMTCGRHVGRLARARARQQRGGVRRAAVCGALLCVLTVTVMLASHGRLFAQGQGMLVRMSEIQVDPKHLSEYTAILKEEAEASVRLEPGVLAIFPMYERENRTAVRILEIYASREAYESHLKTPHFQRYKTTTLPMVTSLKLVDMEAMDAATMTRIFEKMRSRQ